MYPKRQVVGPAFATICSFNAQQNGEVIELFYNECENNGENRPLLIPMKEHDKGVLVKVTIQADGTYKKEVLYKFGKDDAIPMVQTLQFISQNEAVLGICKGFAYTIGHLSW